MKIRQKKIDQPISNDSDITIVSGDNNEKQNIDSNGFEIDYKQLVRSYIETEKKNEVSQSPHKNGIGKSEKKEDKIKNEHLENKKRKKLIDNNEVVLPDRGKKGDIFVTILAAIAGIIAIIIFILCCQIAHATYLYRTFSVTGIVFCLLIIVINFRIILSRKKQIEFHKRYQLYYPVLNQKKIILTAELADCAKTSEEQVIADIKRAAELWLISEVNYEKNNELILLSDEENENYIKNRERNDAFYEKMIRHYKCYGERPEEVQKILDQGQKYIEKIRQKNSLIKDPEVSEKLNQMEETVSDIFNQIDVDPGNDEKIGSFLNIYLPTIDNMLQRYIKLNDAEKTKSEKSKQQIVQLLETTNAAYQRILNRMLKEQELEIDAEIEGLTGTMRMEGLIDTNDNGSN